MYITDKDELSPVDESSEALRMLAKAVEDTVKGMVEFVKKTVDACPNRRVVYLTKHGSPRTRKKNYKRIFKDFPKGGHNANKQTRT